MIDHFHHPPKGYSYEVQEHRRYVFSIWIVNHGEFSYTDKAPKSIWGFYHTKKKEYYAPVTSLKHGDKVSFDDTTPYSAMKIHLNPLEQCMYQK